MLANLRNEKIMANYLLGGKKSLATLLNENLVNNISS